MSTALDASSTRADSSLSSRPDGVRGIPSGRRRRESPARLLSLQRVIAYFVAAKQLGGGKREALAAMARDGHFREYGSREIYERMMPW